MASNFRQKTAEYLIPRPVALVGPVLICILMIGAVIFYKERMLFIDAPHIFFRVVNDGVFRIEENRYGSFITQLFPLIGSKLHIPFKLLLVLYSMSFYLFYLTVALLLVFKYRNYGLAIVFGLYLTLFVSDTFYWPNNEVHQGMGWLLLAFALNFYIATKNRPLYIAIPIFALSFSLAIWTHPLIMILVVFLWSFFWIGNISWPYDRKMSIIYFALILLACGYKYYQGMHRGYDGTKIGLVSNFDFKQLSSLLSSKQLKFFLTNIVTHYWLFTALFAAGLIGLLSAKRFLLFALTLVFAFGYVMLVCIAFTDLSGNRFYIESEYMPLSVICCIPFVYFVLPKQQMRPAVVLMVIAFSVRLVYIFTAATPFTNRVAMLDSMINKMRDKNISKAIIPWPVAGLDSALIMNWGAPVESIMLSKLKGEVPQRTFIFLTPDLMFITRNMGNDTLLGCWEKRPPSRINSYYFQPDRSGPYKEVTYSALMD